MTYWKIDNLLKRWLSLDDILRMHNMWLKIIRGKEVITDSITWIALCILDRSDIQLSITQADDALYSVQYEMYR